MIYLRAKNRLEALQSLIIAGYPVSLCECKPENASESVEVFFRDLENAFSDWKKVALNKDSGIQSIRKSALVQALFKYKRCLEIEIHKEGEKKND